MLLKLRKNVTAYYSEIYEKVFRDVLLFGVSIKSRRVRAISESPTQTRDLVVEFPLKTFQQTINFVWDKHLIFD